MWAKGNKGGSRGGWKGAASRRSKGKSKGTFTTHLQREDHVEGKIAGLQNKSADDGRAGSKVLVIGAGCTGSLVAALLQSEAVEQGYEKPRVSVWEWGRGPAGRMTSFWSEEDGEKVVADVGAQVISLRKVECLPGWMKEEVLPAEELAETQERATHWHHFYAPGGLPSLQRASLAEAQLEDLQFNRKVMRLDHADGRWWASFTERGQRGRWPSEDFDLVIFAGTAQDALSLDGLREALAPAQLQAMQGVRYDHRLCLALILKKGSLASKINELCHGKAELVLDGTSPIHLIARQEVKGRMNDKAFAVVLHSTQAFAASNLQRVSWDRKLNSISSELQEV